MDDGITKAIANYNDISEILSIIEDFGAKCALPPKLVFNLQLACDELLTNAIAYGFPDGRAPKISLSISRADDIVQVKIADDGIPFNPLEQPAPDLTSPLEERAIGGLGIHLVRSVSSDIKYRRDQGQNCIELMLGAPVFG